MLFFIIIFILIALGFWTVRHIDQRRWHRYQLQRDLFFRQNPYVFEGDQQFEIILLSSKTIQKKLINLFMWKSSTQPHYKKVILLREPEQTQQTAAIKVMLGDLTLADLELRYAARLSHSLQDTDFQIGRPIEVLAEFLILQSPTHVPILRIKLDLPRDPSQVLALIQATAHTRE